MNFIDECRALIATDSTWAHGTRAAAEFLGERCRAAGMHVEYVARAGHPHQVSIIARFGRGAAPREFLLQTRLDTAAPGPFARWTRTNSNPFEASIHGDELFGLGAADAKLDFLCKLAALREGPSGFTRAAPVLAGTFGGRGRAEGAIDLIRRRRVAPAFVLVGAPTACALVTAGAGTATIEVAVLFSDDERRYRREHDVRESQSSQSRVFGTTTDANAVAAALTYLNHLPARIAVLDFTGGADPRGAPAQATLEFDAVADFGDPIAPKLARLRTALAGSKRFQFGVVRTTDVGVRLTGAYRLGVGANDPDYLAWLAGVRTAAVDAGATVSVNGYRAGFDSDPRHEFVQAAQDILARMGLNSVLNTRAGFSEANIFSRFGIPCAVWGPGRALDGAPTGNESVTIGDLELATAFYRRMIERFCL